MRATITISAAALAFVLVGAGCITVGGTGLNAQADGGIFRTADRGDVWAQKVAVPSVGGERRSISSVAVTTIVQDPQDAKAFYIGTAENGLLYSYDGGDSWNQTAQVSRGRVNSVAVHPQDKCVVYATFENKLLKTTDCSRSWSLTYVDARADRLSKVVAVDGFNPNVIWLAMSGGELLKSLDGGTSWAVSRSFGDDILRLVMSASDTRRVYVATRASGLWRTDDGGANWLDLSANYKDYPGAKEFSDIALGVSDSQVVVFASKYGLLRSTDGGDAWQPISLLSQPGSTAIYSLALDPKDVNVIYYGTSTTFARTTNGGVNWTPKKLPTTRAATSLLVDRTDSNVIYLGVTKFK